LLPDVENVDTILRRKRKARSGLRACYPCRQRKVKCSYDTPCQTCVEREHPEICSYDPPPKRVDVEGSASRLIQNSEPWVPSKHEWDELRAKLNTIEHILQELRQSIRQSATTNPVSFTEIGESEDGTIAVDPNLSREAPGIHSNSDLLGENVYLGGNSVPAMVVALGKGDDGQFYQQLLGKSILPVFGLDNDSATYPFVDLWGLPHGSIMRIEQLCKLLPSSSDCLQYFRYYRDTAHVLYPGVADIQQFEVDLMNFLSNRDSDPIRSDGNDLAKQKVYGKGLHWVGLLFATLASGCQCSVRPRKERQLTSQVYICCAYECLRIVNYLSHSTLADIQNLLVLGNVISNNMNAGVAWLLLGLTIRLAQSQGLHHDSPRSVPSTVTSLRNNIWWQIMWQDSLLSITYDRASSVATIDTHQSSLDGFVNNMSYAECMRRLCKLGLDIVRQRAAPQGTHSELLRLVQYREKLRDLVEHASDHLKDPNVCKSIRDQLEYWNLYLHRSYVASELCRPTLNQTKGHSDSLTASLKNTCIESLADTVDAFLGLHNITEFASQSWAAVHRSLSSALLLGILREPTKNERVRTLLGRLVTVMSSITSGVDPSELSAPITRSIAALRKLLPSEPTIAPLISNTESISDAVFKNSEIDFVTPWSNDSSSPFWNSSEDLSPYAIMDNIIWGEQRLPSI